MRARELDGTWGDDPSFEVLKRWGHHLVVTEVRGSSRSWCGQKVLVLFDISVGD